MTEEMSPFINPSVCWIVQTIQVHRERDSEKKVCGDIQTGKKHLLERNQQIILKLDFYEHSNRAVNDTPIIALVLVRCLVYF